MIDLAVPFGHGEQRSLGPHLGAEIVDDEAGLFAQLTLQGSEAGLARFDSAAGIGPEAAFHVEAVPVEPHQQDAVVWVQDQRAHALSQPHALSLRGRQAGWVPPWVRARADGRAVCRRGAGVTRYDVPYGPCQR